MTHAPPAPTAHAAPTVHADLPGTRSYARRGFWYVPADATCEVADPFDNSHRVPALGLLVIARAREFKTRPAEVETTWYAVQSADTGRPDVASFYLLKLAPAGGEQAVYEVTGGANGRRCTCPAGAAGTPCVHLDSLAAAIALKALPGPKSPR